MQPRPRVRKSEAAPLVAEPPLAEHKLEPTKSVKDDARRSSQDIEDEAYMALVLRKKRLYKKTKVGDAKGYTGGTKVVKTNVKASKTKVKDEGGGKKASKAKVKHEGGGKTASKTKVEKCETGVKVEGEITQIPDFDIEYPQDEKSNKNTFSSRWYCRAKAKLRNMDVDPVDVKATLKDVLARARHVWEQNN